MTEKRDNSGILFKNQKKEQPNHPDYEGNCTIKGEDYWMKAWLKDGAKGKFMSFAFKPKEARNAATKQDAFSHPEHEEIPF